MGPVISTRMNPVSANGNKLNIGQKVYRITAPSAFTATPSAPRKKGGK